MSERDDTSGTVTPVTIVEWAELLKDAGITGKPVHVWPMREQAGDLVGEASFGRPIVYAADVPGWRRKP